MITYVIGDLLKSDAQCLVNTVNCEGYMGKGIAYQFKLAYPENFKDYAKACRNGKLYIGSLHYYQEKNKYIVNFPTKDKWRENSKIEYIRIGLQKLVELIKELNINSIAIPPLGSGNGGLPWHEVREVIEEEFVVFTNCDDIHIFVYEPSKNYVAKPILEPKLSLSALILMQIKFRLKKFNTFRLQKASFMMDIFSKKPYFKFAKYKYGPYDHSIDVVSRRIREFQHYYNTSSTEEAYDIAYKKLTSESVDKQLNYYVPFMERAANYVNNIQSDYELECIATLIFLLHLNGAKTEKELVQSFKEWSEDKAKRFSNDDILLAIKKMYDAGIVEKNLVGYVLK